MVSLHVAFIVKMHMSNRIFIVGIIGLFTLTSALSDQSDINKSIQEILTELDKYLREKALEKITIPDFGMSGNPVFFGVTLSNLSTIYRTGDSKIWREDGLVQIKLNIGLEQMNVNAAECPALEGPVDLAFTCATVDVYLTLHPDNEKTCTTSWNKVIINSLGNAILHTDNKIYDGKPLDKEILKAMVVYYNKILNGDDLRFNIHLIGQYVELCIFPATVKVFKEYGQ